MNDRLIFLGVALAVVVGALVIVSDPERQAALRESFGLEPELVTEVERMDPQALEAEVARLAALPAPWAVPGAKGPPVSLGVLADSARQCVSEGGFLLHEPKLKARLGLMRYLLVMGAIGSDPDTPLLEPRFRELRPLVLGGPAAAMKAAAEGKMPPDDALLVLDFHQTYSRTDHPVYHGLQLYGETLDGLDFANLMQRLAENPEQIAACAVVKAVPAADDESRAETSN